MDICRARNPVGARFTAPVSRAAPPPALPDSGRGGPACPPSLAPPDPRPPHRSRRGRPTWLPVSCARGRPRARPRQPPCACTRQSAPSFAPRRGRCEVGGARGPTLGNTEPHHPPPPPRPLQRSSRRSSRGFSPRCPRVPAPRAPPVPAGARLPGSPGARARAPAPRAPSPGARADAYPARLSRPRPTGASIPYRWISSTASDR
jgi:hypothetical protein